MSLILFLVLAAFVIWQLMHFDMTVATFVKPLAIAEVVVMALMLLALGEGWMLVALMAIGNFAYDKYVTNFIKPYWYLPWKRD